MFSLAREKNPDTIKQAAILLERENERLAAKLVALTKENLALKGQSPETLQLRLLQLEDQLAAQRKKIFGDSSEKQAPSADETKGKEKAPQTGHGPRQQAELPIKETEHKLDEADRPCPSCGGQLAEWLGQFEESEEIDVVERQFVLRKHKRQKYRCSCHGCVETALGPEKLFSGARYSIDFAIEVAAQKYLDHLPLERQVRIMARQGLVVDSQTLWDQLNALAKLLAAGQTRLHSYLLSQSHIGIDETFWRLMGVNHENKRWQTWAVVTDDGVSYRILDSRSAETLDSILDGFSGVSMSDGYAAYGGLAERTNGRIISANCWAHVRRKFIAALESSPTQAQAAIDLIRKLYEVEAEAGTGPPEGLFERRARLRNEKSREITKALERWALEQRVLGESSIGKAIAYMGKLWSGLVVFLEDPRVPLDNNATERALRGVVVGRKNHYGSRSQRGTEVAALFYSLLESAKLCGVEPKAYLRQATLAAIRGEQIPLPHECKVPSSAAA